MKWLLIAYFTTHPFNLDSELTRVPGYASQVECEQAGAAYERQVKEGRDVTVTTICIPQPSQP